MTMTTVTATVTITTGAQRVPDARRAVWFLAAAALALLADTAGAHVQTPPAGPDELWTAWSADPILLGSLGGVALAYAAGVRRLWRRAGQGRGIAPWQVACFAAGMTLLALALISPLDGLGEALFSAHMAQHILLTAAVPPLLLLGRPLVLIWAFPRATRAVIGMWLRIGALPRLWRWMKRPAVAFMIEAAVLWGWHAPGAIHVALDNDLVHAAMHASFLIGGLLLWETLAHAGRRRTAGYPGAAASSFLTMLHTGLLGALLTFAERPLYTFYGDLPLAWGFTPLEDQQLAGLFMWVVCGIIYMVVALWLIGAWLHDIERQNAAGDRGLSSSRPPLAGSAAGGLIGPDRIGETR